MKKLLATAVLATALAGCAPMTAEEAAYYHSPEAKCERLMADFNLAATLGDTVSAEAKLRQMEIRGCEKHLRY